ncbi:hypothetical protein ACOSQ4_022977 [Xanthoceras sorbifolium]
MIPILERQSLRSRPVEINEFFMLERIGIGESSKKKNWIMGFMGVWVLKMYRFLIKLYSLNKLGGWLWIRNHTQRALAASKGAPSVAATAWSCPPLGMLKLNTDVAVKPGKNCVGVGAVIRDSSRLVVAAISKTLLGCFSAESGEMLVLRKGLLLARNLGLTVQLIEVDACNVVSSVLGSDSCCGENGLIVLDIKALLQVVGFVKC